MGIRIFAQIGKIIHDFPLDFKQFLKLIQKKDAFWEEGREQPEGQGVPEGSQGRQVRIGTERKIILVMGDEYIFYNHFYRGFYE
ncbi:MAG: hypothetical protein HFG59_09280 [Lachnospiraceae bacterium]|nr:hypothetical protein [Lachnospiraceae bacterium]